jgi:hypothetical protein
MARATTRAIGFFGTPIKRKLARLIMTTNPVRVLVA